MKIGIGEKLLELRTSNGWTQKELSNRLSLGQRVVSSYENEICLPPIDVLKRIMAIFDVSADYLIGNEIENKLYVANNHRGTSSEIQVLFDQLDLMRQRQVIGYVQAMLQTSQDVKNMKKGG